jgi:DNA-directed RNA polymerase subunit RPC12/RpoP
MSEPTDYSLLKAAALTSEELLARVTAEMIELRDSGAGVRLEIEPAAAFAVVACVQLALRHPHANLGPSAALVHEFIELVRAKFEPHAPAIALAIERGDLPQYDTPRGSKVDELIRRGQGLMEFILASETPPTAEEIVAFMDSRRDPLRPVLTCPYCGHSYIVEPPLAKIDLYICAKCGRTVETA